MFRCGVFVQVGVFVVGCGEMHRHRHHTKPLNIQTTSHIKHKTHSTTTYLPKYISMNLATPNSNHPTTHSNQTTQAHPSTPQDPSNVTRQVAIRIKVLPLGTIVVAETFLLTKYQGVVQKEAPNNKPMQCLWFGWWNGLWLIGGLVVVWLVVGWSFLVE